MPRWTRALVTGASSGIGDFINLDVEREASVIDVNILALMRLAHAAGSAMARRGSGGIINTASIAGLVPSPSNATYGASKIPSFINRRIAGLFSED